MKVGKHDIIILNTYQDASSVLHEVRCNRCRQRCLIPPPLFPMTPDKFSDFYDCDEAIAKKVMDE